MDPATLPYYRQLRALVSGKRILDLGGDDSLGPALLRESGNQVDLVPGANARYDVVLAFDPFRAGVDPRVLLNGLGDQLASDGVVVLSSRVAPATGPTDSGEIAFRLETLAKVLQDYFRIVTYAFLHDGELRAEWDQYSDRVLFFCRFRKAAQLQESPAFPEELDAIYGGSIQGLVPFSLPYLRGWLNRDAPEHASNKGALLFFLQPLPLYNDPLSYQTFFERYYLLGEEYRGLGWKVSYSATAELKALYGAEHTLCPQDFRHPPSMRDWRAVYAKTLDAALNLEDPDIAYWASYIGFLLDQAKPDAILSWNKNTLLDRVAGERGVLVIHNEVCLDRSPRPPTYYFDPQGVNAESTLGELWSAFQHAELPACCQDLVDAFRRCFVEPWLGSASRAEVLHSLGLDATRKTILIPLQVESDSNVLHNSPFSSMSDFCGRILQALPRGKYNVIVKPHPGDPKPVELARSALLGARIVESDRPMGPLIQASDCVFTISSTTGYEALLAGKPVVTFGRSAYSHLGFTTDLKAPSPGANIEPPFDTPPDPRLDRFVFLASIFYPVSERTMSSAQVQEPLLLQAVECKRRGGAPVEYWPDPAGFDWERFCFDRMAEWLEGSRGLASVTAPSAVAPLATHELLAGIKSLEQEQFATLAERDRLAAEIAALQERLSGRDVQIGELNRVQAVLRKNLVLLQADLAREKRHSSSMRELERKLRATVDATAHSNDHLRKQLDAERERSAMLEADLRVASSGADDFRVRWEQSEQLRLSNRLKRGLHVVLDSAAAWVPERLRRLARPVYLEKVYYRIYPEKRPAAPVRPAPAKAAHHAVLSSYGPYVEFKQRLYGGLPLDFRSLSAPCTAGLVSVVLPVYNGARYVAESIESVLAQTYARFELIIVNDGSNDETPLILDRYRHEPRVRILHQPNRKLPAALNAGFAQAAGQFRTWTSHDNVMLPNMLGELVTFLYAHPDTEMVYADQELIDEDGEPALNSDFCPGYQTPPGANLVCWPRDPGELNFVQNNYLGGCFLYRSWAAELVGEYCTSSFGFEDYDYWMRMNALFRVRHFGPRTALYRYRLHRHSLSSRERELRITERVRHFMASETARRKFFAEPFEIAFSGTHPWFDEMAAAYRQAGHSIRGAHQQAPSSKRVTLVGNGATPAETAPGSVTVHLSGDGPEVLCRLRSAGLNGAKHLHAGSVRSVLYPLLAAANSAAHLHWREGSERMAAIQHA